MSEITSPHHHDNFQLRGPHEVAEMLVQFEKRKALQSLRHFTDKDWNDIGEKAFVTANWLKDTEPSHLQQPQNLDADKAKAMYSDLHRWNRSAHEKIIEKLEVPFAALAQRLIAKAFAHPEQLRELARPIEIDEIPYSVATLPPNLFDIDNSGAPYLPNNDYDAAYLAHITGLHASKLISHVGMWPLAKRHSELSHESTASQVASELKRRMRENDQTFSTDKGLNDWKKYRKLFEKHLEKDNLSLFENAAFMSYQKNRNATAASGFFDQLTEEFDSFLLTSMVTGSLFTSQLRVPIGAYGKDFSVKLIRAATVMCRLIQDDKELGRGILAEIDPETEELMRAHLMRVQETDRYDLRRSMHDTAIEATSSIVGLFSILMAEGVPGCENNEDAALVDILESNLPRKVTAIMPQAVVVPSSLYGRHFKQMLSRKDSQLIIHPNAVDSIMQMHHNRTALFHKLWEAYGNDPSLPKPVRLGLRCPFKGDVTKKFAEALVVIYGVLSAKS